MGQHKHNPTALAAKRGELPPKPKKMSKRETEAMVRAYFNNWMKKKTGIAPDELGPHR